MKIDMLMLLYLRFADFPIVLIRSWSWECSKDEAKAEEHLRSPLERKYTRDHREEKKATFTKSLTGSSKLRYIQKVLIIQIVTQRWKKTKGNQQRRKCFLLFK